MDRFLLTFCFCSFLFSFCPTQGHPTKAFGTHLDTEPPILVKEKFNQGPHSKCIIIPQHTPISIARTSFYSSSFLNINPLYNLLLTRTYCLPQCSHWHNGNQIQQPQISTSSTYHLLKRDQERRKTCLTLCLNSPFYLAFHRPIFHITIHCCSFFSHPLLLSICST